MNPCMLPSLVTKRETTNQKQSEKSTWANKATLYLSNECGLS